MKATRTFILCLTAATLLRGTLAPADPVLTHPHLAGSGNPSSTNWAGYAVTAPGASFSNVQGRWIQPPVTCLGSRPSSTSFWVGLGGLASRSRALEQTGTQAACSARGRPAYSGWYELLPAPPVPIPLPVAPADTISAQVNVNGTTVSLRLDDLTTGNGFATEATIAAPDLSSAEWIAEAPSDCSPFNRNGCTIEPLANFGTVAFSAASAQAGGHEGPISDPDWTTQTLDLTAASGARAASASQLSADGTAFTVAWQSSGGPLELTPLGFSTTPATPVRSQSFTVTMTVGATDPTALAQVTTTCHATIGNDPLHPLRRSFRNPNATCRWLLPATAKGKTLRGTITASARGAKIARSFATTIH